MALERDTYKALEDIVGTDNISEEPAVLDTYSLHCFTKAIKGTGDPFGLRPEAIVLPGSTEEVQAIVKACNKHKIKFKALSTGWGPMNAPGSEGTVQLDLRRMNRILEINEKAMYAVVEPYVIGAQLQAELMKRGLNCNITGAGSNTSAIPLTGLMGIAFMSFMGIKKHWAQVFLKLGFEDPEHLVDLIEKYVEEGLNEVALETLKELKDDEDEDCPF